VLTQGTPTKTLTGHADHDASGARPHDAIFPTKLNLFILLKVDLT